MSFKFAATAPVLVLSIWGISQPAYSQTATGQALQIWNHAYQESHASDTLSDIILNAQDAYVLLDPFKAELMSKVDDVVAGLKANGNQTSAYISIGTREDWRADFAALAPDLVTRQWGQWEGEYFVSQTTQAVINVMKARIDQIAEWGFDWVEFDNMDWVFDDGYRSEYGIAATTAEGVAYYQGLCVFVHQRGMKCMAKNTVDHASGFDGVTYESYANEKNWWDQAGAFEFLAAQKLMLIVHYDEWNCPKVHDEYREIYGSGVSFICEDNNKREYMRFTP